MYSEICIYIYNKHLKRKYTETVLIFGTGESFTLTLVRDKIAVVINEMWWVVRNMRMGNSKKEIKNKNIDFRKQRFLNFFKTRKINTVICWIRNNSSWKSSHYLDVYFNILTRQIKPLSNRKIFFCFDQNIKIHPTCGDWCEYGSLLHLKDNEIIIYCFYYLIALFTY